MDHRNSLHHILAQIGPGKMMNTAYDTAWVARLRVLGEPMSEKSLDWLRSNQLPDGSWGARDVCYYHDRMVCTLAAMTALAREGVAQDRIRCERARLALETMPRVLSTDPAGETIGFEMIVPTLMEEAEALGLISGRDNGQMAQLRRFRAAKLAGLPHGMISRNVTVAFSAEMAGPDSLNLLDRENLQEVNGSVGHSPSATAYYALHVSPGNPRALTYLRDLAIDGAVPNVAPFDVFEQAWSLWNWALLGSEDEGGMMLCEPRLDFLESTWERGRGIGFAAGYTPKDSDVTSVVYDVLARFGRGADIEAVLRFEEESKFRCYRMEANPSISANIHVLGALRQAGLAQDHPSVRKVCQFLAQMQTLQLFWFDKWHASPYYPTAHAVIVSAGYQDDLVRDVVYWILETQNKDGSWGYYLPTAEESAYCLQALVVWKRHGHPVPSGAIRDGARWLADHVEGPYPPLWIGKCLYCPELVVRAAILSALMLTEQE